MYPVSRYAHIIAQFTDGRQRGSRIPREAPGHVRLPPDATGCHGRLRHCTGCHGIPRDSTGGSGTAPDSTGYHGRLREASGGFGFHVELFPKGKGREESRSRTYILYVTPITGESRGNPLSSVPPGFRGALPIPPSDRDLSIPRCGARLRRTETGPYRAGAHRTNATAVQSAGGGEDNATESAQGGGSASPLEPPLPTLPPGGLPLSIPP